MFCTLLYGAYLVLFVTCTYIITHRKGCVKKMQLIAIVALFVSATLGFIFSCIYTFLHIKEDVIGDILLTFPRRYPLWATSRITVFGLYVSANITADVVLIHRCYKIWGAKKKIIVFPIFILIINNGLALVEFIAMVVEVVKIANNIEIKETLAMGRLLDLGDSILKSFLAINFFTNLLIPLMIAGRIWWIGHQVSKFLPKNKFHPTRYAMAVCLESGIMYPLALIPALVLAFKQTFKLDTSFMDALSLIPILIQVVGIAPTFIIVRIALGISIENVHDTIHMNERNRQNTQVLSMWEANCNIDECSQSEQSTA
ncbi:hypothetical protein K435DRAFT_425595 [Dendrothele bispora CBS 962.96]|uniref:Fungal pheromone STE3G-protein-coupled receptor n=1 Tax=Dendrothele bispora (strain CBS 962.96) TaxID=1314807 RepID=A0A4S8L522_DENBC|nr:hypothetical protein K435DRAFT_425595 [Dendrothele bispora CBS 962.96]